MAKDYAKRYNRKSTPKKRKKSAAGSSFRAIFVAIVIIMAIAAGIAGYVHYHQPKTPSSMLAPVTDANATSLKKASTNKAPVVEAKEDPVDYEFYTLLPKINVPDPVQNTTPPEQQPGYWLQIAVYYNMRDASAMLDRLQLLGLDPVITERKSTQSDKTLYVVIMGPYPSKDAAVARQQDLKKIGVTTYIFHVDPPVTASAPEPAVSTSSNVPVVSATPVDL